MPSHISLLDLSCYNHMYHIYFEHLKGNSRGRGCYNRFSVLMAISLLEVYRVCGLMDKAPDFGSGDCRFESCHARVILYCRSAAWSTRNKWLSMSIISWTRHTQTQRLRGATVARLTPDQKAACSNHVGVTSPSFANMIIYGLVSRLSGDIYRPWFLNIWF